MTPYTFPGIRKATLEDTVIDFLQENLHLLNVKSMNGLKSCERALNEKSVFEASQNRAIIVARGLVAYALQRQGYSYAEIARYFDKQYRNQAVALIKQVKKESDIFNEFKKQYGHGF